MPTESSYPLSRLKCPELVEEYMLACPICLQLPKIPRSGTCEHVACDSCLDQWFQKQHTCPVCREPLKPHQLRPLGLIARKVYDNLEISCEYPDCSVFVRLCDLANHISNCSKAKPNNSSPTNQNFTPESPKSTSFTGIPSSGSSEQLSPRPASPRSPSKNWSLLIGTVAKPRCLLPNFSEKNEEQNASEWTKLDDGSMTWTVANVHSKISEAAKGVIEGKYISLKSSTAYSTDSGYAFILILFLNGNSLQHQSHCSLFLRFVQGKNDDNLTWPFTGKVLLQLAHSSAQKEIDAQLYLKESEIYLGKPPKSAGAGFAEFCSRQTMMSSITSNGTLQINVRFYNSIVRRTSSPVTPVLSSPTISASRAPFPTYHPSQPISVSNNRHASPTSPRVERGSSSRDMVSPRFPRPVQFSPPQSPSSVYQTVGMCSPYRDNHFVISQQPQQAMNYDAVNVRPRPGTIHNNMERRRSNPDKTTTRTRSAHHTKMREWS